LEGATDRGRDDSCQEARRAYASICQAVARHPRRRPISSDFDEEHFGNFLVSFEEDGQERCVVNDRGFVMITPDLDGRGAPIATVPSLYGVERERLIEALKL
jgi:hypothetical protein